MPYRKCRGGRYRLQDGWIAVMVKRRSGNGQDGTPTDQHFRQQMHFDLDFANKGCLCLLAQTLPVQ
jgi:hypothetical protein